MEGAPKIPTSEAANSHEATKSQEELREKYEAMTREEAMEQIIEPSIERALDVEMRIQDLLEDQRDKAHLSEADESIVVIHDKDAWNEYKALLAERRQHLMFIPDDLCLLNNLPYHPEDQNEKIIYATTPFPNTSEKSGYAHTLDYSHADSGDNYPRVDQRQTTSN